MLRLVEDLRVISAICQKYGMTKDNVFRYIVNDNKVCDTASRNLEYMDKNYQLKYFDGCFYPYLVEVLKDSLEAVASASKYTDTSYVAYGDNTPSLACGRWVRQSGDNAYDILHVDAFQGEEDAYVVGRVTIDIYDSWIESTEILHDYGSSPDDDPVAFALDVVDYYGIKECGGEQVKLDINTTFNTLRYLGIYLIRDGVNESEEDPTVEIQVKEMIKPYRGTRTARKKPLMQKKI